jgi:hypothetical protein
MRGFNESGAAVIGEADWVHSIDDVEWVGGPDSLVKVATGRYAGAGLVSINGQATEAGDVIEVPSGVAKAFNPPIPPGRYRVVDRDATSASIQNINPITYALTNVSEIGGAVYFRDDPNNPGGLEGLNRIRLELDGTPVQTRPTVPVSNPEAVFDNNLNTSMNAGSASWQGIKVDCKVLSVPGSPPAPAPQAGDLTFRAEALQFRVGAIRYGYDTGAQNASFNLRFFSGKGQTGSNFNVASNAAVRDAQTLTVHSGTTWANSASAPVSYFWRGSATIAGYQLDETGRSSIFEIIPIVANVNSQIRLLSGVVPEVGTILSISTAVANTFFPPIKAGSYTFLKNDGIGPWRLGPPLKLISPIGAALAWGLYVGDSAYVENSTETLVFEVGTVYELRLNAPERVATAEYRVSFPGSDDEILTGDNVGTNLSQNWRPTIAQMVNAAGTNGSITVTAGSWAKTYAAKLQYTQRGAIGLEAGGSYKTGSTFAVDVTSDPLRAYTETRIEVFNSAGVSVIPQFVTKTKSFSLTFPAVGNGYRLTAEIAYGDIIRPNETYSITFSVNA